MTEAFEAAWMVLRSSLERRALDTTDDKAVVAARESLLALLGR